MLRSLTTSILFVAACNTPGGAADTDTTTPTFAEVDTQLHLSCGATSCHGGKSGGLKIDGTDADYDRLVDVAAAGKPSATLVVPGDSANSYLIQKMEGALGIIGVGMPQGGDPLDAATLDMVKAWIDAGAAP